MSTSDRLANIIKIIPDKTWTLHELQIQLVKQFSVYVEDKTVKNCLGAHPDIETVKNGNLKGVRIIGYKVKYTAREPSYPLAWETFKHSFTVWPYSLVFCVVVGLGYFIFN